MTRPRILFLFLVLFFGNLSVQSQDLELVKAQDSLESIGKILITNPDLAKRSDAAKAILPWLENNFASSDGFQYAFDSLDYIALVTPEDNQFRIFTWQLYVDVNEYKYFGAIQLKDGSFIPLKQNPNIEDPEFDILGTDDWYGAVYYKIQAFKAKGGMQYLLFGFNGHSLYQRQKIVDVISWKKKEPRFGSPVFFLPEGKRADKRRIVLTYSAAAAVGLNYDSEMEKILFDHLIISAGPDGKSTLVPDGSYEAYFLKKGKWVHEEKVFHLISEEAPRPSPVLDGRKGSDLFGKKRRNQNQNGNQNQKGN